MYLGTRVRCLSPRGVRAGPSGCRQALTLTLWEVFAPHFTPRTHEPPHEDVKRGAVGAHGLRCLPV